MVSEISICQVWTQPYTCASRTFGSCFFFLCFPTLRQSSNFYTFHIKFFSMAPFHKNPPSFNTLLLSNGQYKNKRKLNGLKHLFGDLVTFGRHIITRSLLGVWTQPYTCASSTFDSCIHFLFFPALRQCSNFHTFHIQIFHGNLSHKCTII
jgi:hypothetical protein